MYEKAPTSLCLNLAAQLDSLIAVAEVSHRDMNAAITKRACGDRAKTAARTGDQGDPIN